MYLFWITVSTCLDEIIAVKPCNYEMGSHSEYDKIPIISIVEENSSIVKVYYYVNYEYTRSTV